MNLANDHAFETWLDVGTGLMDARLARHDPATREVTLPNHSMNAAPDARCGLGGADPEQAIANANAD